MRKAAEAEVARLREELAEAKASGEGAREFREAREILRAAGMPDAPTLLASAVAEGLLRPDQVMLQYLCDVAWNVHIKTTEKWRWSPAAVKRLLLSVPPGGGRARRRSWRARACAACRSSASSRWWQTAMGAPSTYTSVAVGTWTSWTAPCPRGGWRTSSPRSCRTTQVQGASQERPPRPPRRRQGAPAQAHVGQRARVRRGRVAAQAVRADGERRPKARLVVRRPAGPLHARGGQVGGGGAQEGEPRREEAHLRPRLPQGPQAGVGCARVCVF
mmetsp:Transcript_38511/g.122065  ORF Transcript_38511/g.122065 Transcript_38511/m.122065 type:complete len:274 (-) Transcript_38511:72-893(-)